MDETPSPLPPPPRPLWFRQPLLAHRLQLRGPGGSGSRRTERHRQLGADAARRRVRARRSESRSENDGGTPAGGSQRKRGRAARVCRAGRRFARTAGNLCRDEGRPRGRQHRHAHEPGDPRSRWTRPAGACRTTARPRPPRDRSSWRRCRSTASCKGWWCCRRRPPRGVLADAAGCCRCPARIVLRWPRPSSAPSCFCRLRGAACARSSGRRALRRGELETRADEAGRDEIARVGRRLQPNGRASWRRGPTRCRPADRLRRQMLADVSHELRTPLTSMRGYLDTLAMADVVARRRDAGALPRDRARRDTARSNGSSTISSIWPGYENGGGSALEPQVFDIGRVFATSPGGTSGRRRLPAADLTAQVAPGAEQSRRSRPPGTGDRQPGRPTPSAIRRRRHASTSMPR